MIYGHIESVENRPAILPSLIVRTRTALGTYRVECVLSPSTKMARGSERLSLEEIRGGEFVVAVLREHAGWLEAERIDVVNLGIGSPIGIREEGVPAWGADRIA